MRPTAALREIIARPGCTLAVSAHDPLLARLVEQAGFEVIGLSGNAVAASYLGLPDMGFLNLSDMVNVARRISGAVSIPVLVDADTGYGNAMAVQRTVRELEQAGVAGIIIEDQIDYKKCGMIKTAHPVVPAEEHAAKIRAACMARSDADFVICARTDAAADHGLDEAIRRAFLYVEAGADMLDVEVVGTPEEVESIRRARLPVPLKGSMDEGKKLWLNPLPMLADAGYKLASYPGLVRYTVVRSVREALAHLKQHGSSAGFEHRMATVEEYFSAVDIERYLAMEREILAK
ncbi:MAG TPA: oxaloacetate decarboxylase [Burkholderiales bacterium]|nr:oxaloacetate decarboxylase [Burkholderiales bacterium]